MYSVNVLGTYLCYKYAAKQMVEQGRGGRIIGASSVGGKQGKPSIEIIWPETFILQVGLSSAYIRPRNLRSEDLLKQQVIDICCSTNSSTVG